MSAGTTDTVWYRHIEQGSLHEAEVGSEAHRRLKSERTVVDEAAGDVPEPVFERVSAGEVKKAAENPEKVPGYREHVQRAPRRGTVIVQQAASEVAAPLAGPSEDEIQDRIDEAVGKAIGELVEALQAEKAEREATEAAAAAEEAAKAPAPAPEPTPEPAAKTAPATPKGK